MPIVDSLLAEFDHEMDNTRRLLERVPTDKFSWKPHDRSYSLGKLATHVATLPGLLNLTFDRDEFDLAPIDGTPWEQPKPETKEELLAIFDHSRAEARRVLLEAPDESYMQLWSLKAAGKNIFTMPRVAVHRGMVMNHLIHHRGQLTVYLRMCEVPLPGIYGPTADEPNM